MDYSEVEYKIATFQQMNKMYHFKAKTNCF